MDPNNEIESLGAIAADTDADESVSVDDFIKELEAKEKDLHIASDTTVIELAESFDDELPDFMKGEFEFAPAKAAAAPSAAKPAVQKTNSKLEREIEELKERLTRAEAEREEMFKTVQRRSKDFENFKSRTERERVETVGNQIGNLATQILPALDNLNRAVDYALAMPDDKRAEIQPFFDGIILVNQQVNDVLAEMGVQPIAAVGEMFDPHFHEAVATEESDDAGPNTISTELLRGYRIGDRVIRHSMVKVVSAANAPASTEPAAPVEDFAESPDSADENPSEE